MVKVEVVRLFRFDNGGSVKAMVDITIGGQFLVKGFSVVEGEKGLFVGLPREAGKDGNWYPKALPLTPEARQELTEKVLAAYQKEG